MAVANYRDANGHYPPAYVVGPDGRPWHSWRVLILPYMEQEPLFKQYRFDEPWDGPNNSKLADQRPKNYAFPGAPLGSPTTNYLAVVGAETVWPGAKTIAMTDVTDDAAATILLVENEGAGIHWMEPRDLSYRDMDYSIRSPRGLSSKYGDPAIVTIDDTVFRLNRYMSAEALRAFLTIRGGENLRFTDRGAWELLPTGRKDGP